MQVCVCACPRTSLCRSGFMFVKSGSLDVYLLSKLLWLTLSVSFITAFFLILSFFSCAIESDRKEAVWLGPTCRVWLWPVESSLVFGQFKSSWPQTWPRSEAPQFRTLYTLSFSSRLLELLLICECFVWFFSRLWVLTLRLGCCALVDLDPIY